MKIRVFISALSLLFGITSVYGQVNLSEMVPASTDSLQKSRIRYFSPGKGGSNKVWDFSRKLGSKGAEQVMFMKDSTGVVSVIEPGKIRYYRATPDTLVLVGSESTLEKRDYALSKTTRRLHLVYGDSIGKPFRCEGMYCGDHPFREVGTTTVKVDADGSIVLAENDTLRNVLRGIPSTPTPSAWTSTPPPSTPQGSHRSLTNATSGICPNRSIPLSRT